jgi:hypothetical protein
VIQEVSDKERIVQYNIGSYATIDEASAVIDQVTDKISHAMSRRVMLNKSDTVEDNKDNVVLQSRLAYMNHNGFYQYNIYIEALKKEADKYQVQLRIRGGTPKFYYWVPKNEPTASPLFVLGFRKNLAAFERYSLFNCEGELPGFRCTKDVDSLGRVVIRYHKLLSEIPNAFYEYKVAVANIKASMGEEYLFSQLPTENDTLRKSEFIKAVDVEKLQRKHVITTLFKDDDNYYKLDIAFYYE